MPGITFSEEDFKAKMQVPAGWYEGKIKSVKEKPGKTNPDTVTHHIEFLITEGEAAGVTAMGFYNEGVAQQMGDLVNLFNCFGKVEKGKQYNPADLVDRSIRVFAYYNIDMSMNQVKDFQKSKKVTA